MNDRYLFKAKRIDNGEWEIGSLIALPNGEWEIANKCKNPPDSDPMWSKCVITHKVDRSTICQNTGLTDKNGKRIWENDVVAYEDAESDPEGYHDNVFVNRGKVFIEPYGGVFFSNRQTVDMDDLWISNSSIEAEVIGNIFDNQELLEDINETP